MTRQADERAAHLARCRQLAHDLACAARHGDVTDLEALARVVDCCATGAAPGIAGRWRVVANLVTLLTEIDLARGWPRHTTYPSFGQRGFGPRYHSRDRASGNQVRHVVGYVPVGFVAGRPVGYLVSTVAEVAAALLRRRGVDWPDVRLGWRGVALGAHLRSGAVPVAAAGRWLRAVLGSDAEPARPPPSDHWPGPASR